MKVSQLMKQAVQSCRAKDSLKVAAQVMWERDCGCVPVTDDDGRLVGMITDRDISMAAYLQGGSLSALSVSEAMSKKLFSCRPDDTITQAETVMRKHQVHRLPVVDQQSHVVGILSLNDLATEAGREARGEKKEVTYAEVGETVQAVGKPRPTEVVA